MLYKSRFWSAGDFVPDETCQNAVIQLSILNWDRLYTRRSVLACCYIQWILNSIRRYTRSAWQACCYITLDPDKQTTLYQKNRASMLLYNTGTWSAGDCCLGPPGFNCWFSFASVFQWCYSAPRGSPGVGRNTFLSSPHLCFITVFICDLFVSRDDPLIS